MVCRIYSLRSSFVIFIKSKMTVNVWTCVLDYLEGELRNQLNVQLEYAQISRCYPIIFSHLFNNLIIFFMKYIPRGQICTLLYLSNAYMKRNAYANNKIVFFVNFSKLLVYLNPQTCNFAIIVILSNELKHIIISNNSNKCSNSFGRRHYFPS